MVTNTFRQLAPAASPEGRVPSARGLVGRWSLGRRPVCLQGATAWAGAWLTFSARGQVVLSLRQSSHPHPMRTLGRFFLDGDELVVCINGSTIRAPVRMQTELLFWAGEVLVREEVPAQRPAGPGRPAEMISADDASLVSGTAGAS